MHTYIDLTTHMLFTVTEDTINCNYLILFLLDLVYALPQQSGTVGGVLLHCLHLPGGVEGVEEEEDHLTPSFFDTYNCTTVTCGQQRGCREVM